MQEITDLTVFSQDTIDRKQKILEFEQQLLQLPQIEFSVEHTFSGGMYARTLHMKKDSVITGKMHVKDHICIIVGHVTVADDEKVVEYKGYNVIEGKGGMKRVLHVHEDTSWTAIHTTPFTTVEECEATLATNDPQLYLGSVGE